MCFLKVFSLFRYYKSVEQGIGVNALDSGCFMQSILKNVYRILTNQEDLILLGDLSAFIN
jgi:hypothetical protein